MMNRLFILQLFFLTSSFQSVSITSVREFIFGSAAGNASVFASKAEEIAETQGTKEFLFFGASQVLGWQGNSSLQSFPFGIQTASILSSSSSSIKVNATIEALPGDCLAGPGCTYRASITGFLPRLTAYLASTTMEFDWIIILGGANDILKDCNTGEMVYLDAEQDQIRKLCDLSLSRSKRLLILPTFYSPIYSRASRASFPSQSCDNYYNSFYDNFSQVLLDLQKSNLNRVFTANTTSLLLPESWFFLNDHIHLTQYGNERLGAGVASLIAQIEDDIESREKTNTENSIISVSCLHSLIPAILTLFFIL